MSQPRFNFDWNDVRTNEEAKKNAEIFEKYLDENKNELDEAIPQRKQELAQSIFELGSFYNHIGRNAEKAFKFHSIAEKYLKDNALHWLRNHLAFTFQQFFAKESAIKKDPTHSVAYSHYTLATYYAKIVLSATAEKTDAESVRLRGFAFCIRAITEYEAKNLKGAIENYELAKQTYEAHGQDNDDQYARAMNRYAQFLGEDKQNEKALEIFKKLHIYWKQKSFPYPYSARFCESYGDFLYAQKEYAAAVSLFSIAADIYKKNGDTDPRNTTQLAQKIQKAKDDLGSQLISLNSIYQLPDNNQSSTAKPGDYKIITSVATRKIG